MKLHPKLTKAKIEEAVGRGMSTLDNPGFCIECGEEAESCEPDARRYECEGCGAKAVYGAEWLLMCMAA